MKKKNIWCAVLLLLVFGLTAHAEEFTVTLVSSADTWIGDATSTHGSDNYMNIYNSGSSYDMGYVRFDLSSLNIVEVVSASLTFTVSGNASRNDNLVSGRFGLHGMNAVAGNTPQDWDEATLNQSNTGAEVDWSTDTVVMENVTNLDSDDGMGTTETVVAADGGAWQAGTTITTTGAPLASFLESRAADDGLVTFIIRQDAGGDRGYGLCTKDHTTEDYRPVLELTYTSGGASNPQPADGATVNKDVTTQLSWINEPNTLKCDVYFGTEPNVLEMDMLSFTPAVESVNINDFDNYSTPLVEGIYWWRVDNYDSLEGEPNLPGSYWSFTTTAAPGITQQTAPLVQAQFLEGTANFTVEFSSGTPITYTWHRSSDNANDTDADDTQVGSGSDALELTDLAAEDKGWYYCKATNSGGETRSNPVRLSIKQLIAHWALDGNANDSTDNALHGTLFGDPNFVDGIVDAPTGQAMEFDGIDDYIQEPNDLDLTMPAFDDFTPGMTISVWAKPSAVSNWARFVDFGSGAGIDNILFARIGTSNTLRFDSFNGVVDAEEAIALDEWQMFVVTMDQDGNVVIYKNGLPIQTGEVDLPPLAARTSNYIGESNWEADALYAGLMDDIYIYNYAKSADDVADMYSDTVGNFCRTRPEYDWDDSCQVDLGDFALLVEEWLACGFYPDCP